MFIKTKQNKTDKQTKQENKNNKTTALHSKKENNS